MSDKATTVSHTRRRTLLRRVWYQMWRLFFKIQVDLLTRPACRGRHNIPTTGPVLVVSNHQSYLDPPVIGTRICRCMNYLAKQDLFKSKIFGGFLRSVDTIPLDQHGIGFQGIKETLKRLRNGEMVLIFPEGARSFDGEMVPFRHGYINVAVKTGATILPTAIDGAWSMYPRGKKYPNFFKPRVRVEFGEPITPDDYQGMTESELHMLVERRVAELFERNRVKK